MIGRTVSHYRIQAELGRGGMGVVYRAHDEVLRRDVALKLLSDEVATSWDSRARLMAEARAASALNHPAITTVYEVGETDGRLFIVMELVAGKTLRERLVSEGPIEPRALAHIGTQVAAALEEAHSRGVIHGDIKPENIIVLADGRLKLLDFGVARQFMADCATMTRSQLNAALPATSPAAGTIAYMSPEQLRCEPADARGDLYSLGVVLYEMTSGRRPFPGPTATALMGQILNEPPMRLSDSGRVIVPAELARIIHKLLEKKAESRYQSARELHVDLNNLLRDLELGASLSAQVGGKRAVAVLPFKLLTPNAEDEYLSVALADAVIQHLSARGELLVRPTNTVLRYAKQVVDPLLAARELNVQSIVDGSIQKFGQKLRVHVQAWNAADGSTLLSAKHDSDLADLFLLQDRVAESLARVFGLQEETQTQERVAPPAKDPMAYQLYLRAVERMSRLNRWDMRTAIEMLEEALRRDARFADAWALLAEACVQMNVSFEPKPDWMRRAERASRRALALDPGNAAAHCARGRMLWSPAKGFQHNRAVREFDQALRLSSGYPHARLWRCIVLVHVGLHDKAAEDGNSALAANPEDAMTLFSLAHAQQYRNELDLAQYYFERAIAADPSHLWAILFFPTVAIYQNRLAAAEERIRSARQMAGDDPMVNGSEALLWARRGETRKAMQAAQRCLRHRVILTYTHHAWHSVVAAFAQIGKPAQAIALLRRTADTGLPNYPLFRDDPFFGPLRKERGFLKLMGELKRVWERYRREFDVA